MFFLGDDVSTSFVRHIKKVTSKSTGDFDVINLIGCSLSDSSREFWIELALQYTVNH